MEPDKNTPPASADQGGGEKPKDDGQQVPADALSRTPDDLADEEAKNAAANPEQEVANGDGEKKLSPLKQIFRKVNLYILIFALVLVVAGVVTVVNYLNSQKETPAANVAAQTLSADALKQLANTNATVGAPAQTLTIQGNAVITGQTLTRGSLSVAGNFQTGGSIGSPSLTISGTSNLGTAQINSLQVATNTSIQGSTTLRDLNVAGASSFSGAITASQITVTKLILAGNGVLELPNHLSFSGTVPGRSITGSGILGNAGTVSVNGSDTSGSINMGTGNNPTGSGCIVRINFRQKFATQPHVIVSPVGSAAGNMQYYVNKDVNGFSLCTNNTPAANSVFGFDFFVAG
jgi:hypothetical protein